MGRVSAEGDLQLPVDFTMSLAGFDRRPVTQPLVYTFTRDGDGVVLSDDRDVAVDARHDWVPAPWDVTHIEVRRAGPILGIFDEDTEPYADYLMRDLADARRAVRAFVPGWSGRFVAYDITDLQAMDRMSPLTTQETAGVAFPVHERPGSDRVASYRFMVDSDIAASVLRRGFVFRHELVHVALGGVDDHSPTWLTEGVAEYASRAGLPLATRQQITRQVLAGAGGAPLALRSGADFYGRHSAVNYELSNLVCDYLATTRGRQVLFDLLDAFAATRILTTADVERVLGRQLGTDSRGLTQAALDWVAG